jgi:transposase
MREHPEIKVVSRDRGGDYASAAVAGAPQAIQCADRFHVLKNLGEVVEGLLARHLATKRQKNIQETLEEHIPIDQATRSLRRSRHPCSVGNSPIERNAWPGMSRWWLCANLG